jgi:ADP-heptose:LPS heptosyltransferase
LAPLFEEFENFNFYPVDFNGRHNGIKGLWQLFLELKKTPYSGVADLHAVIRTHFLSFFFSLCFFKVRKVNKGRKEKHLLTRKKNKKFQPLTPTVFRYVDVFRKLDFPITMEDHEFPDKNPVPQPLLPLYNQSERKWIGIAPFASYSGKTYPPDLMQQVIAFLQKDYQIFLFGAGNDEIKILSVWEKAYNNVVNTAGKISLRNQLDLMPYLDLMISMDSANGHIAANYDIPVITIWGVTHPYAGFSPWNQNSERSILADRSLYPFIPTSVYGNICPKGYENCMRTITPEKVIEVVRETMTQTSS